LFQRGAHRHQIARLGVTGDDAVDEAFQICQWLERGANLGAGHAVIEEGCYAILPRLDLVHVQ